MGATVAKLDTNDKVIDIISQSGNVTQDNKKKLIDLYNKHGVIKIKIDADKLNKFIVEYTAKLLKSNKNLENNLKQNLGSSIGSGSLMLSMFGFVMMLDNSVESFGNINVRGYNHYEHFGNIDEEQEQKQNVVNEELLDYINEGKKLFEEGLNQESKTSENNFMYSNQESKTNENNLMYSNQESKTGDYDSKTSENDSKTNSSIDKPITKDVNLSDMLKTMTLVVPKAYLTTDRVELLNLVKITFLSGSQNDSARTNTMIEQINILLESISKGNNTEIKIANLIGLMIRCAIIFTLVQSFNKLGENVINTNDQMQMITSVLSELLSELPSDKCSFYNNSMDFIKFTPDLCQIKSELKNISETNKSSNSQNKLTNYLSEHPTGITIFFIIFVLIVAIIIYMIVKSNNSNLSNLAKL
jgi:hypothetical protein